VNIEQLNALVEKIKADPAGVPADELTAGRDAIRVIVDEAKAKDAADITEDEIAVLAAAKAAKTAIDGEITGREQAAAAQAAKAAELLADLDAEPEQAKADTDDAPADKGDGDTDEDPAPAAEKQDDTVTDETPELVSVAASLAAVTDALAKLSAKVDKTDEQTAPKGRSGRPGAHAVQRPTGPTSGVVTAKTYVGTDENGRPAENTYTVAQAVHERFRGAYQAPNFSGRMPVIHVESQYPEDRVLGELHEDREGRPARQRSPPPVGCAPRWRPCTTSRSSAPPPAPSATPRAVRGRPRRHPVPAQHLRRRGGARRRVWTVDDDAAGPGTKGCYVVDCPGMEDEVIEAIYLCLEFSNITTRFDPETTASATSSRA
jgi:hypothetical protein